MDRTLYDHDYELFRSSVREFLHRQVSPRTEHFVEDRAVPRDVWVEAGKHGLLGLQIPEACGGSEASDYRHTAVITEDQRRR